LAPKIKWSLGQVDMNMQLVPIFEKWCNVWNPLERSMI
jgi:hypothetical protein